MVYRTYENYKWGDGEIVAYLYEIDTDNLKETYILDVMQSKTLNEQILLIIQELNKIESGKFSFANNILNFEYPKEHDFGNSFSVILYKILKRFTISMSR